MASKKKKPNKPEFFPKEMADCQQALFGWCELSLRAYRGQEVPEELLEAAAQYMEETFFDLDGPHFSGHA